MNAGQAPSALGGKTFDWASTLLRHDRWLRTVVAARLGESQAVDEVMQDLSLAALVARTPVEPERVAGWLYRLAVRGALLYRKRPMVLSMTHKPGVHFKADVDVSELAQLTPDRHVARRRILRPGQISSRLGDRHWMVAARRLRGRPRGRGQAIQDADLRPRQGDLLRRLGGRSIDHRQPEDPPPDYVEDGQQIVQPFGRAKLGLLRLAAGLQDLVKGLDVPAIMPSKNAVVARLEVSRATSVYRTGRALVLVNSGSFSFVAQVRGSRWSSPSRSSSEASAQIT